jgi:hypothetical protein
VRWPRGITGLPSLARVAILTVVLLAGTTLLGGCDLGGSGGPSDVGSFGPGPVDTAGGPGDSEAATESGGPQASDAGVPGFEGWKTINGEDVDIGQTESGLAMTLNHKALWSDASKGVLFYTSSRGDFRLTAIVQTQKTSDSTQDPGGDGTIQLAGLMARADSSKENDVYIAAGSDASGLAVETASTTNDATKVEPHGWASGDAELKLCRVGSTFTLWRRAIDSGDDFTLAATYTRDDLKGEVQVGPTIFSGSEPDITGLFDNLELDSLAAGEAC